MDIETTREWIAAIDDGICNLLRERARLSESVQRKRIAEGGSRLDISQENAVLQRYIDALGPYVGYPVGDVILMASKQGVAVTA